MISALILVGIGAFCFGMFVGVSLMLTEERDE